MDVDEEREEEEMVEEEEVEEVDMDEGMMGERRMKFAFMLVGTHPFAPDRGKREIEGLK